jgi:hypothetical protein
MTRKEVRDFIAAGVDTIRPGMQFGSGRISEWNSNRSNEYVSAWLESISNNPTLSSLGAPFDAWGIKLHIAKLDAAGSSPEEYEAIIDECDLIAQKLVRQYNQVLEGYRLVTISSIGRVPFIHRNADDVTGVLLSFTLTAPDQTNLCG